jgi:Glycosyltransferase family 87
MVRENAFCALMAGVGSAAMAWLGLYGFAWNDYDSEARPAFEALVHGQLGAFLRLAPAYGGSLIERAPFALLPSVWGGGEMAVYRMVALPCLIAVATLGIVLVSRLRAQDASTLCKAVALGVCVANPLTLRALELGHPEELLGAALCVLAVLSASRDRPLAAGVLLGLAIANKEWALLAVGPVLLMLPAKRRAACCALTVAVGVAVLVPLLLISSGGFSASARAIATPAAAIFQPWQLWWFFGHHGALVHGLFGLPKPDYRTGPAWAGEIGHPLILLAGVLLSFALWLKGRRRAGGALLRERDALLGLAVLFLLRCLLDTWDTVYYPLPFILALLAWELNVWPKRPPLLALSSTVLCWLSFQWLPTHASPDLQAAFFLAWSLPLAVALVVAVLAPAPQLIDERELLRQTREPLVPRLANQY